MALLEIDGLSVEFPTRPAATLRAVDGVSLRLDEGEVLGIVGESGSGKSVTDAGADGPGRLPRPPYARSGWRSPADLTGDAPRARRRDRRRATSR